MELRSMDVNITRRTLLRYEKANLIPEPIRGGQGRGKGRTTDYPDSTASEAFAAYYLLNGNPSYRVETVASARKTILSWLENGVDSQDITDILRDKRPYIYGESVYMTWFIYKMIFFKKIRFDRGIFWVDYPSVGHLLNSDKDFENEFPVLSPDKNLNLIENDLGIVYLFENAIAIKHWTWKEKKWVTHWVERQT